MKSELFKLSQSDFLKGLIMAVIAGFALPILLALQSPNFSFATVNWHQIFAIALDGGLSGFSAYIVKQFFSDSNGQFLGKIG